MGQKGQIYVFTSVFCQLLSSYNFDGGGFKIEFVAHVQKEVDSKLKNLLDFPIQILKLFILPQLFTNKRRSPLVQINKDYL